MSSVSRSPSSSAQASRSSSRPAAPRQSAFHAVARWLRFAPKPERARAPAPAALGSWRQHRQAMLKAADRLLARARSESQPMTMAVFDLEDLPEMESVFGAIVTREVVAQVVFRLKGIVGSRGLVIRTDATVFTLLMPGYGRDRAHHAIERTMGNPCCIELDADDHEIVLVPDFKVHTFRAGSESVEQVYIELRRAISEAQHREQRRQRYLQRERESHTRPTELLPETGPTTGIRLAQPVFRPMVPTIPMPLKAAA
jgi:GGDEF domain-containing protein